MSQPENESRFGPVGGSSIPTGSAVIPEAAVPTGTRPRMPAIALVVAVLAVLVAGVGVVAALSMRTQLAQVESELEALQEAQGRIQATQASIEAELATLGGQVGNLEAAASQPSVSPGESNAMTALATASDAYQLASGVDFRLDQVVNCINEYMKTVGDSGGGRYQYFFCQ